MKTILVDDEMWMMKQFEAECSAIDCFDIVGKFTSSEEALHYARDNAVEFALLDIKMPVTNGIALAKELKNLYSGIIIVFVTAYPEYLKDFIDMKADYYVLKPYTRQDVIDVLQRAKLLSKRLKKHIFIRTFGDFDVFVDDRLVYFKSAKAKELLALLVEKEGSILTAQEALAVLWENKEYTGADTSLYRMTASRLKENLAEAGIEEILINTPHGRYLDTSLFDCDLYGFLDGDREMIANFHGEYMKRYSWGEMILSELWRKRNEKT